MKIAVLLSSFNRREKTLNCLKQVFSQNIPEQVSLEVFLTDDASVDGTAAAVKKHYPQVRLLAGSGELYWAGGMRNSWTMATHSQPNYFLLLNDDTYLFVEAIKKLIESHQSFYRENSIHCICVGSTQDPKSGTISYGGRKLFSKYRPNCYLVNPGRRYSECDLGNANIMLVPSEIVENIGILSEDYTHAIADFDYTLRAKKAGFAVIVSPGVFGYCTNDHQNIWKKGDANLFERIQTLYSIKGLAYTEYLRYIRRHFPVHLPLSVIKLWSKALFPKLYYTLKKINLEI